MNSIRKLSFSQVVSLLRGEGLVFTLEPGTSIELNLDKEEDYPTNSDEASDMIKEEWEWQEG